jgi:hypothetical protein
VFEHQAAFTEMLRVGRDMRKRMFDTIEQRHADDLGNGKAGMKLYEDLLSAVRDAGVPEAETEFESRFLPLLNKKEVQPAGTFDPDRMTAAEGPWSGVWRWISSTVMAAAIAGAAGWFFGDKALKWIKGEPPALTQTPGPATPPAQPAAAGEAATPVTATGPETPAGSAIPVPAEGTEPPTRADPEQPEGERPSVPEAER